MWNGHGYKWFKAMETMEKIYRALEYLGEKKVIYRKSWMKNLIKEQWRVNKKSGRQKVSLKLLLLINYKKVIPQVMREKKEEKFQKLKKRLSEATILTLSKGKENFVVYTETSKEELGGILI